MGRSLHQMMTNAGVPVRIVVYHGGGAWRYAIQHEQEIADGYLHITPEASQETAREAAEELLSDIYSRFYDGVPVVLWEPPNERGAFSGAIRTEPASMH